jgi:hypothetical protein
MTFRNFKDVKVNVISKAAPIKSDSSRLTFKL